MPRVLNLKKATPKRSVHPNSRKAVQFKRAVLRDEKIKGNKSETALMKQSPRVERFLWFKLYLEEDKDCYTDEEVSDALELYLQGREQMRDGLKGKTQKSDFMRMAVESDIDASLSCGLEIPNLLDKQSVANLRIWNGDYNSISLIKSVYWKLEKYPRSTD